MALQTFNQNYYLANNPDVMTAVLNGVFASAEQHYEMFGEREGRMPSASFDPAGYLSSNADVFAAVQAGVFSSALQHFEMFGLSEGRTPGAPGGPIQFNEAFYLEQNPDVAAAIPGTFSSGYQHFIFFGASEGRAPAEGVLPGTPGQDLALTPTVGEVVEGRDGDDTVVGLIDSLTPANDTFNVTDQVDGKAGTDTLNLFVSGGAVSPPAGGVVRSMEIVNLISDAGGSFANSGANVDPAFFGGVQELWQANAANNVVDVNGVTIGFRDLNVANTVEFDANSGAIALDSVTSGSTITVDGSGAGDLDEELSISGSVESGVGGVPGTLTVNGGPTEAIETLSLDLDSAVIFAGTAGNATAVTFDASRSEGDIDVDLRTYGASLETATFGGGNDGSGVGFGVVVGNVTEDLTVDMGAGDDQVALAPAAAGGTVELATGTGEDNVLLVAGSTNITADTQAALDAQAVSLSDFSLANDTLTLQVGAAGNLATQNPVNGAVDDTQTLLQNLESVAGVMDNNYAQFVFGSDLIIYADDGDRDFGAGDLVVTLTGVSELLTLGTNIA
jgi:hypothetical protein